jgi:hypothetical protein
VSLQPRVLHRPSGQASTAQRALQPYNPHSIIPPRPASLT